MKAKLKKVRQQLNTQTNANQMQTGGGAVPNTPTQVVPALAAPPTVTPPPANVPRKAQVGRPARVAKPKPLPHAATVGPKKATPPKPPVTRSKTKNQPAATGIAVTDAENDAPALMEAEYDTDELVELPTDSKPEAGESEQGQENTQIEEQ